MLARDLELNPDLTPGSKRLNALTYEERQAIIEVNNHHPIGIKEFCHCILSYFGHTIKFKET